MKKMVQKSALIVGAAMVLTIGSMSGSQAASGDTRGFFSEGPAYDSPVTTQKAVVKDSEPVCGANEYSEGISYGCDNAKKIVSAKFTADPAVADLYTEGPDYETGLTFAKRLEEQAPRSSQSEEGVGRAEEFQGVAVR